MPKKYHVNNNNEPKPCNATKRRCHFGDAVHFDTMEEARDVAEEKTGREVARESKQPFIKTTDEGTMMVDHEYLGLNRYVEKFDEDGQLHSETGPSYVRPSRDPDKPNNIEYYHRHGDLHREDGPAVRAWGDEEYWHNGHYISDDPQRFEEWKKNPSEKSYSDIASEELHIDDLQTHFSDSYDFHDVHRAGLERSFSAIYRQETGAAVVDREARRKFQEIGFKHFGLDTLKTQGSDGLDFNDTSVDSIKSAFKAVSEYADERKGAQNTSGGDEETTTDGDKKTVGSGKKTAAQKAKARKVTEKEKAEREEARNNGQPFVKTAEDGTMVVDHQYLGSQRYVEKLDENGERHSDNGPAYVKPSHRQGEPPTRAYYYNHGDLHREDGPAVSDDGKHEYWHKGHYISSDPQKFEEWKKNPSEKSYSDIAGEELSLGSLQTQHSGEDFPEVPREGLERSFSTIYRQETGAAVVDQSTKRKFQEIGRKHFGFNTLKSQGSDRLDFQEVSVDSIKSAFEEVSEFASQKKK